MSPHRLRSDVSIRLSYDQESNRNSGSIKEDMGNSFEEDGCQNLDLVCAICDNGGEILSCEGKCLRSFHATEDASPDCQSLGYTRAQVAAMKYFLCKNCKYEKYQCFACGKLGSAKKEDGAEVFPCAYASCGHFYHAKCVSLLLFPTDEGKASNYAERIVNGEKFACPVHRCCLCKLGEDKEVKEMQFAVCRRCPKSYHRKCLPRDIAFKKSVENGIRLVQRAWEENLLSNNRILIYCMNHEIDKILRTPVRNHIVFPNDSALKRPFNVTGMDNKKVKIRKLEKHSSVPACSTKRSMAVENYSSRSSLSTKSFSQKTLFRENSKNSIKRVPTTPMARSSVSSKISIKRVPTTPMERSSVSRFPKIDDEVKKRIYNFAQAASSNITIEDIKEKLALPSTHGTSMRTSDKITMGMVERSVEAIETALQKLDNHAIVEDAKAVCGPNDLVQFVRWKNKLNIYLAPFLHGNRYTSFGRHFTKVGILQEIVDKLQWYLQSGDMVVDFCCGANDFSSLLKENLEAYGKDCLFKNYDLIQPKNDFNFEKRDWMTVQLEELPAGNRLVMGLNPPFGYKASLANKFIDKALTFKPKLIILIVPKETERLDVKNPNYQLIWEDSERLSGKSFYFPGSMDTNNKRLEQSNMTPPLLSLWSRSDWTSRHLEIATLEGHLSNVDEFCDDLRRQTPDMLPPPPARSVDMPVESGLQNGHRSEEHKFHDGENQGGPDDDESILDKLIADTFSDRNTAFGGYEIMTDFYSSSPNAWTYSSPARNNSIHEQPALPSSDSCMQSKSSDMNISSPDISDSENRIDHPDCENRIDHPAASINEHDHIESQTCNLQANLSAVQEKGFTCHDQEPPGGVQYQTRDDSHPTDRPAVGVQYRRLDDSPPGDTQDVGVGSRRLDDSLPGENRPARSTSGGLHFAPVPFRHGSRSSSQVFTSIGPLASDSHEHPPGLLPGHQWGTSGWLDE